MDVGSRGPLTKGSPRRVLVSRLILPVHSVVLAGWAMHTEPVSIVSPSPRNHSYRKALSLSPRQNVTTTTTANTDERGLYRWLALNMAWPIATRIMVQHIETGHTFDCRFDASIHMDVKRPSGSPPDVPPACDHSATVPVPPRR